MSELNLNNLTPEQVESIKASGGFSGSMSGGLSFEPATTYTPAASVPISGYGHALRPRIKDAGHDPNAEGLVSKPNIDKYNAADAERKLKELEAQEALEREKEQLREVTDPRKLQATLQALSRKVNRLEKQLKEAQSTIAKLA